MFEWLKTRPKMITDSKYIFKIKLKKKFKKKVMIEIL